MNTNLIARSGASKPVTYMQKISAYEFEKFDEMTESFYELIDSLHRFGDYGFLKKLMSTEHIYAEVEESEFETENEKIKSPERMYEYINRPESIISINSKLSKINKGISNLKCTIEDLLYELDQYKVTNPKSMRKRLQSQIDTKNNEIMPILMLLNQKMAMRNELEESLEKEKEYDVNEYGEDEDEEYEKYEVREEYELENENYSESKLLKRLEKRRNENENEEKIIFQPKAKTKTT